MKKTLSLSLICSLLIFCAGFVARADALTETIATIDAAKDLAENAGGIFVEGEKAPALTGNQVALPVIEEDTGKILGHIVADRDSLVSALNAAGHTEVASAISGGAAGATGAAAGSAVGAGIISGTAGMAALGVAAVAGIALAVSGGGGGGGSGNSTSSHSSTSNH